MAEKSTGKSLVELIDQTRLILEVNSNNKPLSLPNCFPVPATTSMDQDDYGSGLRPGSLIIVYGSIPNDQGRFRIDLYASPCQHIRGPNGENIYDPSKRIIALHFNVRLKENNHNLIVMNTYHQGKWNENDERLTYDLNDQDDQQRFPFKPMESFCLIFLVEKDYFDIYVDGNPKPLYRFKHRILNIETIKQLHIEGPNLQLDSLEFRQFEQKENEIPIPLSLGSSDASEEQKSREIRESKSNDESGKNPLELIETKPNLPYYHYERENFSRSFRMEIQGMVMKPFEKYFVVNFLQTKNENILEAKKSNIPLHISLRVRQKKLIRNSLLDGQWGDEELCIEEPMELEEGQNFKLSIENVLEGSESSGYVLIKINDKNCCKFKHRSDPKLIDTIEINGSCMIETIKFQFQTK